MTNKQLKKTFWQLGIYGLVLGYIACDLFVFEGPIAQKLDSKDPLSAKNIAEIARAGADTFVAGSAIFNAPDYAEVIAAMRGELASAG